MLNLFSQIWTFFFCIAIGTGTGRFTELVDSNNTGENEETLETYAKLQYVYFIATLLTMQGRYYQRVVES